MILVDPTPAPTPVPDRVARPSRAVSSRAAAAIPGRWVPFASCVRERESGGSYTARNPSPSSTAQGAYQFLDSKWRHGLAHMVAARLVDHGWKRPAAMRLRSWLRARPIAEWPPVFQDVGFVAVLDHPGGWRHWALAGSRCDRLIP